MLPLSNMLGTLQRAVTADPARRENVDRTIDEAQAIGALLPLVHRTGPPKKPVSWKSIVTERAFRAGPPGTDREQALGISKAVYFFLGCGAYPEGSVAFVLETTDIVTRAGSFTPFDSGAIERYAVPTDPALAATWDDTSKTAFLAEHLGMAQDVVRFAGPYLAAHVRNPLDYVRRGQNEKPDYAAYHGLTNKSDDPRVNDDRRIWTIEVQVHEDVPFGPGGAPLREIVLGLKELLEDLPDDLSRLARVADNEILETIAERIVATCEARKTE